MKSNKEQQLIVDLLVNRAAIKQDIADYSEEVLSHFRKAAENEIIEFKKQVKDPRVRLKVEDKGVHEFRVFIGSDVLVFQLHSNVFRLPDGHGLWQSEYFQQNDSNGYFAIINVYNFLAESFEQNRLNDLGYLLGRIYVNKDKHFMIEGEGQLGQMFTSPYKDMLNVKLIHHILRVFMVYAIEFDLITPPYEMVQEVSLIQIQTISSDLNIATGKRLGFKFSAEDKEIF